MTKSGFLEEFSGPPAPSTGVAGGTKQEDAASARAAFDEGYNCGWQDGAASVENDEGKQRAALAEAVQELKFTYFEARQHVMKSLRPVLEAMVNVALPEVAVPSLGGHLVECLEGLANKQQSEVVLRCAPENETMLKEAAEQAVDFPIIIETETTLASTQVVLHFEQGQSNIDLEAILASIREAVSAFYETPNEGLRDHG